MTQVPQTDVRKAPSIKGGDIYTEFILWTAMPYSEKVKLGLETQGAFCQHHKINEVTPWRWKQRPDFEQRVDAILKMWSTDKTPDVIHAIYKAAIKGNPMSQLLWLQYFKKFSPKTEVEHTKKVEIGVNDIRFLINSLPEPLRSEHHANFRKLIEDAQRLRHVGQLKDAAIRDASQSPSGLSDEADNDAHDVSGKGSDAVAKSYPFSLRANMVWEIQSNNHQGPERRWEK